MFEAVIGGNKAVKDAVDLAQRISASQSPVLIFGEPGTGKELLARCIHECSLQSKLPFVVVDCAMLLSVNQNDPACCMNREADCFSEASIWKFVLAARGGTLYLKNVDMLAPDVKKAVARILACDENASSQILPGSYVVPRVIASMTTMVDSTEFGKTFDCECWELSSQSVIKMPPLQERGDDLILLAEHFVRLYGENIAQGPFLVSPSFLSRLRVHDWPGNVRELKEAIVRSCASGRKEHGQSRVQLQDVSSRDRSVVQSALPVPSLALPLREAKARVVEQFERQYLRRLMFLHRGNVSGAARSAGTERRTFQRLLRKYGLDRNEFLKSA
ncbi:sigma 54-interacting transcriptional regulator [Petrachloros mirabilis]